MAQGNLADGDYFINCAGISQSTLRAVFGVWINVCVAVIALCIRYRYRSHIKRSLLEKKYGQSIWYISPAVTPTEVFELRSLLYRALNTGRLGFVLASIFCLVAASIGAASTVISNRTVVTNTIERNSFVEGILATREHNSLSGASVPISSRITALDKAGAPLTELFDYIPNDGEDWIYSPNQWNNTWKANCTYNVHESAELHVYPSNSSAYQNQIPSLGRFVPDWATIYLDRQAVATAGFYEAKLVNGSGNWRDLLVTHLFVSWPGSDPLDGNLNMPSTANISFVNFLAHHVGRDGPSGWFEETTFKSDVHVVDCAYTNTVEGGIAVEDQAAIPAVGFTSAVTSVVGIYTRSVVDSSIRGQPVKHPTGQEMIRYFQAYAAVKDSQYPHPKSRLSLAQREVVQIRLSTLVTSVGVFLVFLIATGIGRAISFASGAHQLHLPSSQLDWIVQAAQEHTRHNVVVANRGINGHKPSPAKFASENEGLAFVVTENLDSRIMAPADVSTHKPAVMTPGSMADPQLATYDPWAGYTFTTNA